MHKDLKQLETPLQEKKSTKARRRTFNPISRVTDGSNMELLSDLAQ